jgi:hypothetical protein
MGIGGLEALGAVSVTHGPFAVAHNEDALGVELLHVGAEALQVGLGGSFPELVDKLKAPYAELLAGHLGIIEVGHQTGADGAVQAPLGERDAELAGGLSSKMARKSR